MAEKLKGDDSDSESKVGDKRTFEKAQMQREAIKAERRREIVREERMERAGHKKSKTERDNDRDISEKIALGQAQPSSKEAMFDQRLFNQTAGLGSGFGHEEDYHLYDKPLFADRTAASIYKNVKSIDKDDGQEADTHVRKVLGQTTKDEDKSAYSRSKPVEFEKKKLDLATDNFKGGLQKK